MIDFPNEECKWTWLAGLMDADSSIDFYKKPRKSGLIHWNNQLVIRQTNFDLVKQAQTVFGHGNTYQRQRGKNRPIIYGIRLCKRDKIKYVLQRILPYLIKKKRQAELLLEAIDILQKHKFNTTFDDRLNKIFLEIRSLHDGKYHASYHTH